MSWAGHVERIGVKRNACRLLVGNREGTRTIRIPRCKCVDNIKIDLEEIGCGDMDWIGLAQDRDKWRTLVNMVINLRVP
jgi:hypothetical protein